MNQFDKPQPKRTRRADGYSVNQRADGRWEARVTVGYNSKGNPQRKSFYGKTRAEALDQAQRFKVKLDGGGFAPVTKDSTVGEWLDTWLKTFIIPNREPKTVRYYETYIRVHLKPAIGKVSLRKLTVEHVQQLINKLADTGASKHTVRGLHATLKTALNQAWKNGIIEINVAARATPPKIARIEPEFLELDEINRLNAASKGHVLEHLFRFAISTGVRVGEACGLRWEDVNFDSGLVTIHQQLQRVNGVLILKDLKSTSSRRTLPLGKLAAKALTDQKALTSQLSFDSPMGLVFLNSEGRPLDQKYVDKHLKMQFKKAGIKPLSFHKLRHTFATQMLASEVELIQVSHHLGHSQISLTANQYAHRVPEAQHRAVSKLDDVLGSLEPKAQVIDPQNQEHDNINTDDHL